MSFNKKQKPQVPAGMGRYLVIGLVFLFLFIALTNTTFLTIDAGQKVFYLSNSAVVSIKKLFTIRVFRL